jgi:hypothetical protein
MTRRPMPECCVTSLAKRPGLDVPPTHVCETCGAEYVSILIDAAARQIIWTPIDSPLARWSRPPDD